MKEKKKDAEFIFFHLRITKEIYESMMKIWDKRKGISRSGWIIEAIYEKITRENKSYFPD